MPDAVMLRFVDRERNQGGNPASVATTYFDESSAKIRKPGWIGATSYCVFAF
jgi:hypothetical protein